jgi:hypothetical protein
MCAACLVDERFAVVDRIVRLWLPSHLDDSNKLNWGELGRAWSFMWLMINR